jgi:hypothetical protein
MSEPTLNDIGDYNTLKGEKKRVVWAVIVAGLVLGAIYVVAYKSYEKVDDSIKTEQNIKVSPMGKTSVPMR